MIISETSEKSYSKQTKIKYELLKSLCYIICNTGLHFGYTGWTFWLYRIGVLVIQAEHFGYTGWTLPKTAHMKTCRWLDVVQLQIFRFMLLDFGQCLLSSSDHIISWIKTLFQLDYSAESKTTRLENQEAFLRPQLLRI